MDSTGLVGQVFGRLTVVSFGGFDQKTLYPLWVCQCECGGEKSCTPYTLRNGSVRSCGCLRGSSLQAPSEFKHGPVQNLVDRRGERYGMLVVLDRARSGKKVNVAEWLCQCDCGVATVMSANSLRGGAKSCGCQKGSPGRKRAKYRSKTPPGQSAKKGLLHDYVAAARNRGLVWGLSVDQFYALTKGDCHYCGQPPSRVRKPSGNGEYVFNGVDRVVNTEGYLPENTVSCCDTCNHAKKNMSKHDFLAWVLRVADFQAGKDA